jgi:predicted HicB family RNase H-like nuclease
MEYLKYKGYTGSVEYSEEDKCLFGKVQGLAKDLVTYEGSTIEELTKDFEGAVDDYLDLCEKKSIVPRRFN